MSNQDKVKGTKYYGTLDVIQQKLILNRNSMEAIKLGINMSGLTSFENWVKVTSPREKIKEIVKELVGL